MPKKLPIDGQTASRLYTVDFDFSNYKIYIKQILRMPIATVVGEFVHR